MRKLAVTLVALGLMMAADAALAECRLAARGAGDIALEENGQRVSYALRAREAGWEIDGFGWHASAMSWCAGCNPGGVEGAYVWLDAQSSHDPVGAREDLAFTQGVASAWFSGFRGLATEAVGAREPIEWSGLTGYARRYRGQTDGGRVVEQIIVVVGDGCLRLKLYSVIRIQPDGSATAAILPFLNGLHVERSMRAGGYPRR